MKNNLARDPICLWLMSPIWLLAKDPISYKQVLFFFKKRLSNSYLLSDFVAVSCAAPGIFDRGWRGGGGAGVHTRLFPSPQRILQWFINGLFRGQTFSRGGGGRMGAGGLNANFYRNP